MAFVSVKTLLAITLATALGAQPLPSNSVLSSLVQAERDFAAASVTSGLKQAFLNYLADSAVVFRPHPVNAKHWYEKIAETPLTLNWCPVYAEVAQSGDFGYTTGPWEMTDNGPRKREPAHGHYFSVWKKQTTGIWKVIVDLGIQHPAPAQRLSESWQTSNPAQKTDFQAFEEAALVLQKDTLLETDRAFSKLSETKSYEHALQKYSERETRWYRPNHQPLLGKRAIREYCQNRKGMMTSLPTRVDLARSADLGYTVGSYDFIGEGVSPEKGYYVRMWKQTESGKWQMVLEVISPLPAAQ